MKLTEKVGASLRSMNGGHLPYGMDTSKPEFTTGDFITAHECLLRPYTQALTREDSIT
eukprot:CAMPEP_0201948904 /NCGR_PEP_ID=MMETSP0903-20130614/55702_1 /ASSEMBLY_ACC=CAM_ASM_000552 /TAXON_ID=420261 /ORGANISM="Thalassiosira antarctica, Strain CCMP982" /LENGTH=57 /DNA_ID=CAMNT_0048492099 /DNA_START=336 /DNA_END=509 /DNA_ORIENTATION=-